MPTVTTRATFVIFKDEPSSLPVKVKAPSISKRLRPQLPPHRSRHCQRQGKSSPTTAVARAATSRPERKGGAVLTTKCSKPPAKHFPNRVHPRKRKLSVTDRNRPLGENPASRIRKITELPKVEEEVATEEGNAESSLQTQPKNPQATADSTCDELTVPPLVDVSTAYEPSLSLEEKPAKDDVQASETKAEDTTAVSEPPVTKTPTKLTIGIFSTPERKRLYSVFTFATPSPTSKRYANSRASSVDRFSDYDFDPLSDAITFHTF
ncbi:hypothetical protein BC629DRAFT_1437506 [Irpex lacteus]|nr:hypothetical protein BC629DRAFT_1437506 [Irpex lacteus]